MRAIDMVKGEYIKELLNKGFRDGERGMYEYRPIIIQKGIIPNAEGSAQVDLGGTKVLAGVKIDVDSPLPDKPGEGNLVTSAELLPRQPLRCSNACCSHGLSHGAHAEIRG